MDASQNDVLLGQDGGELVHWMGMNPLKVRLGGVPAALVGGVLLGAAAAVALIALRRHERRQHPHTVPRRWR